MPWHDVQQGDWVGDVCDQYGITNWQKVWDLGENADLKTLRKDPNILHPGDRLWVPEPEPRVEQKGADSSHKFVKKTPKIKLHVVCKDDQERPLASKPYKLKIDGKNYDGTTDGDGAVMKDIPVGSKEGVLEVAGYIYPIRIAHLDPITEISGVKARLNNLGYDCGGSGGDMDDPTAAAIRLFQKDNKLEESGAINDATTAKLKDKHGC